MNNANDNTGYFIVMGILIGLVVGFSVGMTLTKESTRTAEQARQQAVDAMTKSDIEASFWQNEFDGCNTMNDAIPVLASQVTELEFNLDRCRSDRDEALSIADDLDHELSSRLTGNQCRIQIEAQVIACNLQYACKMCLWDTGNLSWCMKYVYDAR